MKRLLSLLLTVLLLLGITFSFAGCGSKDPNKVVIYSSCEDFRNEYISSELKKQFPNYDISVQYLATGKNAAKVKSEGKNTEADIVLGLETGYMNSIKDQLADISSYDTSRYIDGLTDPNNKYLVWEKFSGTVVVNPTLLAEKGLAVPQSYDDLLKPEYKGLISMPSPKSSSTGYMFLMARINELGEDEAFAYFDKLPENILQFTSSGSGPVNALVQGEAAIGLGMVFQSVTESNKGADLQMLEFPEGHPYSLSGMAMIDGRQNNAAVKDVFDYLYSTLIYKDKELYSPELIFKDQTITIENYPKDLKACDMTGLDDLQKKDEILAKWKY